MSFSEIAELQRIFLTRLDTLDHILEIGAQHLPDLNTALQERLAPDMLPLGTQIFACNQPRGFLRWCAGEPVENLSPEVTSVAMARSHIAVTKVGKADYMRFLAAHVKNLGDS